MLPAARATTERFPDHAMMMPVAFVSYMHARTDFEEHIRGIVKADLPLAGP